MELLVRRSRIPVCAARVAAEGALRLSAWQLSASARPCSSRHSVLTESIYSALEGSAHQSWLGLRQVLLATNDEIGYWAACHGGKGEHRAAATPTWWPGSVSRDSRRAPHLRLSIIGLWLLGAARGKVFTSFRCWPHVERMRSHWLWVPGALWSCASQLTRRTSVHPGWGVTVGRAATWATR